MHIPKPCNENWDSMKIGLISRHCDHCKKDVMDFTIMNRIEILKYLILNYENETCGRIHPSQLNYSHEELLIVIKDIQLKTKNRNLAFYFLTIGTLMISSCSEYTTSPILGKIQKEHVENRISKNVPVSISKINTDSILPQPIIKGDIHFSSHNSETAKIAEIMPEFVGGEDSLMSYVQKNLQYPSYEKEHKIEGRVIVSFIVKKDGSIENARIKKSVKNAKNFDKEALRIINNMPLWIPGSNHGKKVDIEFFLPISFEL